MTLFLGIDGGGSQTTCVIADESRILGSGSGAGCNPVRYEDAQVRNSLHTAIRQACAEAGVEATSIGFACLGVAGTAREDTELRVQRIAAELISGRVLVVGDMVVAHESVFFGHPGLIVVAGTGSIAYGRNERGETARAGGWGAVISDEGSGYWIGKRAVTYLMRSVDGGETTALITRILHQWHIASREELGRICNAMPPPDFAQLFAIVQRTAEEGDRLAQQILDEAGAELAALARMVARRLWLGPKEITIAITGGVFQNSPRVRGVFESLVHADRPQAAIRLADLQPVQGAIYLARKMAQSSPTGTQPVFKHHS